MVEPVALIRGDVRLTTGGDELRAGNLRVIFEKEPDRPASRPATAPSAPTDLGTFRPKKIAHVLAGEQVRLASVTRDAEGYLLRRLTLASPSGQVAYDVAARRLRCLGPGQFVAEDYRPPSPAAGGEQAGALPGGGITRPWNAAFSWQKSMEMDQKRRIAVLKGGVVMGHSSGRKMVKRKELKIRPLSDLPPGRRLIMACESMEAEFAPPDARPGRGAPAAAVGSRLGELVRFYAVGDVNLKDGPRQVLCQRILYRREPGRQVAIIWGFREGAPPRNAELYEHDERTGRLRRVTRSPKLAWYPRNNRIVVMKVRASGGG